MSLPLLTRADLLAIRTDLGLTQGVMAERIGISRQHYLDLEAGNALISLMLNNAIRWVQHVKAELPSNICGPCDGTGTIRPTEGPMRGGVRPRIRCEACEGEGVKRALVSA